MARSALSNFIRWPFILILKNHAFGGLREHIGVTVSRALRPTRAGSATRNGAMHRLGAHYLMLVQEVPVGKPYSASVSGTGYITSRVKPKRSDNLHETETRCAGN